jgi:hypothetical protein
VTLKQEKVWKTSTHLRGKHEVKDEIIVIKSRNKQFSKASRLKLVY